jgi:hypothetical protein
LTYSKSHKGTFDQVIWPCSLIYSLLPSEEDSKTAERFLPNDSLAPAVAIIGSEPVGRAALVAAAAAGRVAFWEALWVGRVGGGVSAGSSSPADCSSEPRGHSNAKAYHYTILRSSRFNHAVQPPRLCGPAAPIVRSSCFNRHTVQMNVYAISYRISMSRSR